MTYAQLFVRKVVFVMHKNILGLFWLFILMFSITGVFAAQSVDTIHYFEQRGCPECAKTKAQLEEFIIPQFPDVDIQTYSIQSAENQDLLKEFMRERNITKYQVMVPILIIGDNVFQLHNEQDAPLIIRALQGEYVQDEIDSLRGSYYVNVPFLGRTDMGTYSLFLGALIIGSIDGLNICSIGALILILMIVLGFKSRTKIFLFGGMFILTTVAVYGLFVFAWSALFTSFARYIGPINLIIAIASLLAGLYFAYKFFLFCKYGPACEFSGNNLVINATNKLKAKFADTKSSTLVLLGGVMTFATIITLVELPCSFGLPLIYGGMVANANLNALSQFLYVLLYLFFYMLIEVIIFVGAVITKQVWFADTQFITWVYGAGALVLFFLSYYYLFGI